MLMPNKYKCVNLFTLARLFIQIEAHWLNECIAYYVN